MEANICGGAKGQTTQQTNQAQTYAPNPQAAGYITNAMNLAQNAAGQPFSMPLQTFAGFSPQQQQAFGAIGQGYNAAQPYYAQAAGYFSPQGAQQFLNPYAQNVMAGLKDIFGQQMAQTTGNLTQAAGGIGADRIAVGQANLANQQGLAAGQTLAGLYQPALQAAQTAGANMANLGTQAQGAALSGANALYGAGAQQQNLQQQALNAQFAQQQQRAMFPYQQANFLAGITGALAPGLGGTTTGQGTTVSTPAQPSIWSQLLGGGLAGAGILGQTGAFGSQGWLTGSSPSYGGGNIMSGDAYGGSGANPLPGLSPSDYGAGFARGGPILLPNPFRQEGGSVGIPSMPLHQIQPHIPSLNLNPPQQSGGGGGGGLGDIIGTGLKIAGMFLDRGGRVDPRTWDGFRNPYDLAAYQDGGAADDDQPASFEERFAPVYNSAYRLAGPEAMQAWRDSVGATPPTEAPAALAADEGDTETPSAAEPTGGTLPPVPTPGGPATPGMNWSDLALRAGLGIMGGTSPFAGVNIGRGAFAGLQSQEEQQQAQAKLALEREKLAQAGQLTDFQKASLGLREKELGYKQKLLEGGLLDDDSAKLAAQQYVRTGTMPPLGYGQTANQNRARVWQHVQQIASEQGLTGADLAAAKADFMGQTAGARTAGVRGANIDMAVEEARKTFPLALAASEALPRGQFVPWNKAVQAVQAGTSSPELARFVTANQAVITAYSQAMSRTGVNTVHAQGRAEELMSTATSPQAYRAVIEQMEKEMQAAKASPDAVRRAIEARISGRPEKSSAAPVSAIPPAAQREVGKVYQTPKGPHRWTGSGWDTVQ